MGSRRLSGLRAVWLPALPHYLRASLTGDHSETDRWNIESVLRCVCRGLLASRCYSSRKPLTGSLAVSLPARSSATSFSYNRSTSAAI